MRQPLPFLILTLLLASCTTSPTGQQQLLLFSEQEMAKLGDESFEEIKAQEKLLPEGEVTAYVRCVTAPLTAQVGGDWEVRVFQSDDVNAFALPGRHIGIYTGLLSVAQDADALAAVIGHEIAHVLARHGNARVSTQMATQTGLELLSAVSGMQSRPGGDDLLAALGLGAQVGILLPFSRQQESEADLLGLRLMADAGFNPNGALRLWEAMGAQEGAAQRPPELLSTHPASTTRLATLRQALPGALGRYDQARAAGRSPACRLL